MQRVVLTGLGAVTPVGNTADEFWSALLQGRSGVGPITKFDATDYPTRIAGEVKNFDPLAFVDKKEARRLDPFLQYAMAAAAMAGPEPEPATVKNHRPRVAGNGRRLERQSPGRSGEPTA